MRDKITLACEGCDRRNYAKDKNKRLHSERVQNKKKTTARLEFKKFCNTCRTHTVHRETK